jgi:inner membrane protein
VALFVGAMASRLSRRARPLAAIAASAAFVAGMLGLSRAAEAEVRDLLRPAPGGEVVDVILTPDPANAACWSVITIERHGGGEYVMRPATLSLFPAWQPPETCASHRFGGARPYQAVEGRIAAYPEIRQPLARLRDLARTDCWVAAWLQFGRAPVLDDRRIFDLRFEARGENFTSMPLPPLEGGRTCPAHLTRWEPPRADLLRP